MNDAWIFDAVRTPFGKHGKAYAGVRPDDLSAFALRALTDRHPNFSIAEVADVVLGNANGAGEENRNVARMSVLLNKWPTTIPGVTVNRLCGSGMEAIIQAARLIETGDASVVLAGGVESMTRAPWVMQKPERAFPAQGAHLESTTLGWRLVNSQMDPRWTIPLGETAEILADRFEISREEQDEFALHSHRQAARAWADGAFTHEIVHYPGVELVRDESVRPEASAEQLAQLSPAFRNPGSVTAGNSSPLSDGASALVIASEEGARAAGIEAEPLARIVARAAVGNDPNIFGIAPVEATRQALAKAGMSLMDMDFVELNEAFAAQTLACMRLWPDMDPEKLNVHGGAIALGHPLGASGGRLVGHVAHLLRQRGSGRAVATICIGTGQGLALVLER